jgi:flagellar biosynthesis component FlhA
MIPSLPLTERLQVNYRDQVAFIFLSAFALLLAIYPQSTQIVLGFMSVLAFLGFQSWVDRKKELELDEMRAQMKQIKDKIDAIVLKKGILG